MAMSPEKEKNTPAAASSHILHTSSLEEIAQFITDRWQMFVALATLVVVVVIGQGVYKALAERKQEKLSNEIFTFRQQNLGPIQEGKMEANTFVENWKKLDDSVKFDSAFYATMMESVRALAQKKSYAAAVDLLSTAQGKLSLSSYQKYFLDYYLAVMYEESNQKDKAVALFEQIVLGKTHFLDGKIYLDIGRLHRDLGNKEKAQKNFNYVLENYPNQREWVQMAKYYLSQM